MVQNIKKSMFVLLAFTLLLAGCKSKSALQQSQEETIEESIIIDGLAAVTPDTVALQHLSANATPARRPSATYFHCPARTSR
jgi:uncharacterized protein YcfL